LPAAVAETIEGLLQRDVAIEVVAPVPRGAAEPFALDEAAEPLPQLRPRIAFQSQRGIDFDPRRQEEGGAHRGPAHLPRLFFPICPRLFQK
jgi:hypothetical protein